MAKRVLAIFRELWNFKKSLKRTYISIAGTPPFKNQLKKIFQEYKHVLYWSILFLFLEIEIGHLPKNILILKTILNNFSIINSFFAESQLSTRKKDFFGYPLFCHYLGTRQRRLMYIESLQSCSQQATISHSLWLLTCSCIVASSISI